MVLSKIKRICLWGFTVRLIVFAFVLIFSNSLTEGYLRSNFDSDDLRYIESAVIYSRTATSLVDGAAFINSTLSVGENIGLSEDLFLWDWMMCIMMYIFKYTIILRIINIIFSVVCIFLIYRLCNVVYSNNSQISILAAKLYAFFPYPVFFSSFLYKDQFLTLIMLSLMYQVYNCKTIFTLSKLIKIVLLLSAFTMLRRGLTPLLVLGIGYIEYKKGDSNIFFNTQWKKVLVLIVTVILCYIFYVYFYDIIKLKYEAYVLTRKSSSSTGGLINYVLINTPFDLWKAPFTYAFTVIQPLYFGNDIANWEGVVGILNVCSIPIVIVNLIYIFLKKQNNTFWIVIMTLFIVMLVVSAGITRHFYYLLPYVFIFYSAGITTKNNLIRVANKCGIIISLIYGILILPSLFIK